MHLLPRGWYPKGWDTWFDRCPTGGYCGDNYYKKTTGKQIPEHLTGTVTLYPDEGIPFSYTNCTGCRLPISHLDQARINNKLGYTLEVALDDDFMKALEGL